MILLVIAGVHQLVDIRNLDHDAPIVAIQKRLGSLRVQRVRATQLTLVASPLAWTPMRRSTPPWLIANLLFGVAALASAIWASRRYADRMGGWPRVERLMRHLAGHNLNAAAGFLASVAEFERAETPA